MTLLIKWAVMALALVVTSFLVGLVLPGGILLKTDGPGGWFGIFVGVALLALVNSTIGKVAKLLVLPLNCMTLGLASLAVNALLFWWVGTAGWGFEVNGFFAGLLGSILFSASNALLGIFLPDEEEKKSKSKKERG
jgi:putative membrane protein